MKPEHFWDAVHKSGESECWRWGRSFFTHGYGCAVIGKVARGAHRVAWELTNGPIPPGMLVCHRCDNRWCCNPNHLFLGTAKENTADMYSKGRQKPAKGNQFKRAKLSPAIVAQMRLLGSDMPNKQLGQRFGVSQSVVSEVLRGKSWAHVPIPLPPQNGGKFRSGEFAYQSKLTRAIVDACRKEYARGKVTMTALAKRYGITKGTMRHAIVGITWR